MADLATITDVVGAWRPLTEDEGRRAVYWLGRASRRVRERWPDTDARITAGTLDPLRVQDVVVDLVLAVLDGPPVRRATSWSEGSGAESRSVTLATSDGDDVWSPWMVEVFDGRTTTLTPLPAGGFPPSGRYERHFLWPEDC